MRDLEDPCENCATEEGDHVLELETGEQIFVCERCSKKLKKRMKKTNHGNAPVK